MRRNAFAAATVAALGLATAARATVYNGNGDTSFGGPVGNGSLTLTDDGTTITAVFTRGTSGGFNDALVIYVDSKAGGIATNTSTLGDANDDLRRAISGFDGNANRSLVTFPNGFQPDYAISLSPVGANFGATFGLVAGGNNSLVYDNTYSNANLSPTGNSTATTYTFTIDHRAIGLAVGQQATIGLLGTYLNSGNAYRSTEAIAGNVSGSAGYGGVTGTAASFTTVPEPASLALLGLGGVALLRRRK